MFKTAVYASADESFQKKSLELEALGLKKDLIYFADSRRFTRLDVINRHVGEWVLFIDHDCSLDSPTKEKILQLLTEYQGESSAVVAGLYENPRPATRLQRAHNWIANAWLESSYADGTPGEAPLVLGGCFLVRVSNAVTGNLPQDMWGAEDKLLARILKHNGAKFYFHPEIKMKHNTSSSWNHFLRRAWLHGLNDVDYAIKTSARLRYSAWLKKIASADSDLTVLVLLHFCIQKTATLIRQILRMNKR